MAGKLGRRRQGGSDSLDRLREAGDDRAPRATARRGNPRERGSGRGAYALRERIRRIKLRAANSRRTADEARAAQTLLQPRCRWRPASGRRWVCPSRDSPLAARRTRDFRASSSRGHGKQAGHGARRGTLAGELRAFSRVFAVNDNHWVPPVALPRKTDHVRLPHVIGVRQPNAVVRAAHRHADQRLVPIAL